MSSQFTAKIAIFETVDANTARPRQCSLCNANTPTFAYRLGEFADGGKTGHCCAPCACRALIEMAERGAGGGSKQERDAG